MSVVNAAVYLKDATVGAGNVFRETIVRVCLSCCTVVVLIWLAVLMYISFYYAYMPTVHHTQPVFLKFSTDCGSRPREGLCSYPEANVTLSKGERILMRGQKYQVFLDLEMPLSPVNEQLGMFMVSVKFLSNSGKMVATSSRSCMVHFKSGALKLLHTIFMSLPLILGLAEEKQSVAVNLFENYVDDSYHPVTNVNVVVMAKHIEVYRSFLRIEAQFSGFRYILFNWPMSSALICISANFIVICIIFFFAYNAFTPESSEETVVEIETEEDGQERLYSEARRRDLGSSERRVPRSPVRLVPPASLQRTGRSKTPAIHTRNRVVNSHLSLGHNTPRRRLRSASFPSCRWEPRDLQAASGPRMGEAVRSTPSTPRGDRAPVHTGFRVGNTQGHAVFDYAGLKDNRDSEGNSGMDTQHSTPNPMIQKSDSKDKDISDNSLTVIKNKQNIKTDTEQGTHEVKNGSLSLKDKLKQELSPYTIIEPKSGQHFYSYSDFEVKRANAVKEKENQPISDKYVTTPSPLNSSSLTSKNEEHSSVVEEEKKSILRRRSTNKTRAKFGLSLRKMLPKR